MDGYIERLDHEQQTRLSLAWHTASLVGWAFHQPGKMPKLEKLLAPKGGRGAEAPARQSPKEMAGVVQAWRILLGGPERAPPAP